MSKVILVLGLFLSAFVARAQDPIEKKWLDLLRDIVETNSSTDNIEGLDRVRERLIPEFKALGFGAAVYDVSNGHKVVAFDFPDSQPKVLLIGHIDTVFQAGSPFQKMTVEGDRIRGPGVMDMKGGVVLLLNLLSELKDEKLLHQIRVVLDDDEEIGSGFSNPKLNALAKGIPYGLVFEPGLPDGSVVASHSGVRWLLLSVQGKAAHAGMDFTKGLNACVALSKKVVSISALTNLKANLTMNVGVIEGGAKPNIVCEKASAKFDVRFRNRKDYERALKKIKAIAETNFGGLPGTLQQIAAAPEMSAASTRELLHRYQNTARRLGQKIDGKHTAYASDASQIAASGIKLLVGLGPVGEGPHTDRETMFARSYPERLKVDVEFVRELLKGETQ